MIFDVFTPLSTGGNCTFLATTKILVSERPRPRQLSQGLGLTSVQVHDDDDDCCLCEKQPRPSSSYLEGRVAPQIKGLEKYSTLCVANNVPKKGSENCQVLFCFCILKHLTFYSLIFNFSLNDDGRVQNNFNFHVNKKMSNDNNKQSTINQPTFKQRVSSKENMMRYLSFLFPITQQKHQK